MGHSVLKGVVIYGHDPDVSSRVCNFTYGIRLSVDFDPKWRIHDYCSMVSTAFIS
jgi:hypothetical protein